METIVKEAAFVFLKIKLWPLETHQNGWLPCRKMTLYWTYDWNKISEATKHRLGSSWNEEKHQLTHHFRKYVCFIGTNIVVSYKYTTCNCYNLCKAMLHTLGMVIFTFRNDSVARIKENLHAFVFYKVSQIWECDPYWVPSLHLRHAELTVASLTGICGEERDYKSAPAAALKRRAL